MRLRDQYTARRRDLADQRNEQAFRTLIEEKGNRKSAAARLGVSETWLRQCIARYCRDHGYETPLEAAYGLGRAELDNRFRTQPRSEHAEAL